MSKFERIIREPLVMGGQARIRDTGITVNEIVRLSLAGSSQAEILQQFPQLEAEDVHQALAYAMEDTIYTIAVNRSNVLDAILPVISYNELILGQTPYPIDQNNEKTASAFEDMKQKLPEILLACGKRAKSQILSMNVWRHTNFSSLAEPVPVSLDDMINKAIKEAKEFDANLEIKIAVESSESLLVNENLQSILAYILAGTYDVQPHSIVTISKIDDQVLFSIKRELQKHVTAYHPERPYSLMQIAMLLLYRLGSELKIRQEENTVIFEFTLPIVEEQS